MTFHIVCYSDACLLLTYIEAICVFDELLPEQAFASILTWHSGMLLPGLFFSVNFSPL